MFCKQHFLLAHRVLHERGLFELIAKSDDDFVTRRHIMAACALSGKLAPFYDPLVDLIDSMITAAATRYGIGVLDELDDGAHLCPVCLLEYRDHAGLQILHGYADLARAFAIKHSFLDAPRVH